MIRTALIGALALLAGCVTPAKPPFDAYHCSPSCFVRDDDARYSHLACYSCLQRIEVQGYICGVSEPCPPDAVGVDPTKGSPQGLTGPFPEDAR